MHKRINDKPIKKIRRVELEKDVVPSRKPTVYGDIDDLIFGDERSVPSSR